MVCCSTSISNASLKPEKACTLKNEMMYNQDYGAEFEAIGNITKSIELYYNQTMTRKGSVYKTLRKM